MAQRFNLYVIELPPGASDVCSGSGKKGCLYVGSTAKSAEERFRDHASGHLPARIARHGVVRLRPDLCSNRWASSREKAAEIERKIAKKLRNQGYAVWQGDGGE